MIAQERRERRKIRSRWSTRLTRHLRKEEEIVRCRYCDLIREENEAISTFPFRLNGTTAQEDEHVLYFPEDATTLLQKRIQRIHANECMSINKRTREERKLTMQNLFVEIDGIHIHRRTHCAHLLPSRRWHLGRFVASNLLGLERRLVGLQNGVGCCFAIVNVEVVVVGSRENVPA